MNNRVYINYSSYVNFESESGNYSDKNLDSISQLCIKSINKLLLEHTDLDVNVPLFFGTMFSSLNSLHQFNRVFEESGALWVNPSAFPNTVLNSPSCRASIHFGITEPIYNISNGELSAIDAFGLAYMNIYKKEIDCAIVCIADEYSEIAGSVRKREFTGYGSAFYLSRNPSNTEVLAYEKKTTAVLQDKVVGIREQYENAYLIHEFIKKSGDKNRIFMSTNGLQDSILTIGKGKHGLVG